MRQGSKASGLQGRNSNSAGGNSLEPYGLSYSGGRWPHYDQDVASEGAAPSTSIPSPRAPLSIQPTKVF